MIDVLKALLACRSAADFHRAHRKAGNQLTPLEIHWLLDRQAALPEPTRRWLDGLAVREFFALDEPKPYRRLKVAESVHFYRDPDVPPSRKRLLVVFCGYANRVLMPMASFLQSLPSERFDVVVLADFARTQFLHGIARFAGDFLGLMRWVEGRFGPEAYGGTVCYGASAGGLPALRAGILMGAGRAVSVGGRFPGHVRRIVEGERALPGFDPLCGCVTAPHTTLVCAYSAGHEADRLAVEGIARMRPVTVVVRPDATDHSPFGGLPTGQMRALYGVLLGFETEEAWDEAARPLLRTKPGCAAVSAAP